MKKHLVLLFLLAVVHLAMGKTGDHLVIQKDSIIVEFGQSGKIVVIVENKDDFDRLKSMDINQIIKELDLQLNEETGELTVVEIKNKSGNKEIVRVKEEGAETEVSVGGIKVIVDEKNGNTKVRVETGQKKKSDPSFRSYFNTDIGINNYFNAKGQLPSSDLPYAVKGWGSWNLGLNWMASQKLSKGFYWDFGLGVQWYNFKFENRDYQAVKGDNEIEFTQRTDLNGLKSKISSSYLTAHTLLKLDFGKLNNAGSKGLKLGIGPYVGYRLGGSSKFVYREDSGASRRKEKQSTGIYLNNFRYGVRGELGFGRMTFFSTYDLNSLFQEGKGPELYPVTFGLVF